jgi:CheY-like chemotaxis protein
MQMHAFSIIHSSGVVTAGAFLRKAGFIVLEAESASQALDLLSSGERFDALVSDYAMPDLNGVGFTAGARMC